MRLTDDYDEESKNNFPVIAMAVGGTAFVLLVLVVVLLVNKKPLKNTAAIQSETTAQTETETQTGQSFKDRTLEELISGSKLTSDQLDIWEELPSVNTKEDNRAQSAETDKTKEEKEKPEEEDLSKGGTRTMITNSKGEEEWIPINPYLVKSKYDYTNLVYQAPIMQYFENGSKISYVGVDVSKEQGFVDYNKLKKQGIEFVMIRLGTRGYGSGQVTIDEYYAENIKAASDAGLRIGIYFFSQAINEAEAIEEANVVIQNIAGHKVTYPIAFDMETIDNDTARIDKLSKAEKTKITSAFLKTIKTAGYKPIIYGKKEWLMQQIDLTQLIEYDVWLAQEKDIPDYPYKFSMWQYTTNGKLEGISGNTNLNISFIDYDLK